MQAPLQGGLILFLRMLQEMMMEQETQSQMRQEMLNGLSKEKHADFNDFFKGLEAFVKSMAPNTTFEYSSSSTGPNPLAGLGTAFAKAREGRAPYDASDPNSLKASIKADIDIAKDLANNTDLMSKARDSVTQHADGGVLGYFAGQFFDKAANMVKNADSENLADSISKVMMSETPDEARNAAKKLVKETLGTGVLAWAAGKVIGHAPEECVIGQVAAMRNSFNAMQASANQGRPPAAPAQAQGAKATPAAPGGRGPGGGGSPT